jgi:Flp pilus assembly protein TadB
VNLALATLALWAGAGLVLSTVGPVRRPTLAQRVRPYVVPPSTAPTTSRRVALSLLVGDRLSDLLRTAEPLERRLRRVHHPLDPGAFRFRQASHAVVGLGLAGALAAALPLDVSPVLVVVLVLATPVLVMAAHEQQLVSLDRAQTRQVVRELPVIAEQLAMLLAAGRSVSAAIAHLGERGHGPCAADLRQVTRRLQQGVDEAAALREWADLRPTPGVVHLVGVLTLAREATDLDRLVEQEAEAIRADAHRELLATLERRSQQVWVPVTVATLLPGSLLLLVPFLDALRLFAGS